MTKSRRALIPSLALLILSVGLFAPTRGGVFPSQATPGAAPPQDPARQTLEGLANVRFQTDVRVFSTLAALNLAGFDFETPDRQMSIPRSTLRETLASVDPELRARLQTFYRERRQGRSDIDQLTAYVSLALVLGNPPDFPIAVEKKDVPDEVVPILGFEKLVGELYRQGNLGALWPRYQAVYEQELAAYRPVLIDIIRQTLDYFRIPPRIVMDRQIVLIPDMLGPKNIVNARNVGSSYFVILGSVDRPTESRVQLQHEYLHFLLDPLIEKHGSLLTRHDKLLDLAQNQPNIRAQYQNQFVMVVTESLVEVLNLKLNPVPDMDAALAGLYRRGLVFAPAFYRELSLYDKTDIGTFPSYIEPLFQNIDDGKIRDDEKWAVSVEERLRAATETRRQQIAAQEEESHRRTARRDALREVENLLRGGQLGPARAKLEEILKQDSANAHACFYLAQVSAQEKDFEKAFQLYSQAAQLPTATPSIRAWSKLRMGSYLASQERFAEARQHFQDVIAMSGDLEGAKERAAELSRELPEESTERKP